ncbi:MAG: DUF3343 domain-containing protein [Spirochaetales bacterium]|nr:DUF3343 domain-containing protein [Spirochaetales bacterium]
MTRFIATFYSQYGAVQFHKHAKKHRVECRLAPVPRALSSSCGTCAHYTSETWDIGFVMKDLEAIYEDSEDGYMTVFSSE